VITQLHPAVAISLVAVLALAVIGDLRARRIPNWLSLGGLALGVMLQTATGGTGGAGNALLGAATGGLLLFPLWLLRGMAAGDVKLMAAVGAHLNPAAALAAGLVTLIAGGLIAVVVMLRARRARIGMLHAPAQPPGLPYAPAIAIGGGLVGTLPLWLGALRLA
jgi:prepilin peptidase CpaA